MWGAIFFVIATVVIYLIYKAINKKVTKGFDLKETSLDTDLREFRESHAAATTISDSHLNIPESPVRMYERMCILEPLQYKNDPKLPQVIREYNDIIIGKIIDTDGRHVPSETLLGEPNPDYIRYLTNQIRVQKRKGDEFTSALQEERERVVRIGKEEKLRSDFLYFLIEKGVPAIIAYTALNDAKLNSYTAEDWNKFCSLIKGYLETYDRGTVSTFIELFDEKEIVLNQHKFEIFEVFFRNGIPNKISVQIVRDNITIDQALRMLSLVQLSGYEWEEAMEEIIKDDLDDAEADELRKKYGWKG